MIESLRIENWAIVEEAELELGPGLNVLTGETGAGKSIVLGALSLLAGGRGSAEAVRTGAERALIEALFDTRAWPEVEAELSRREIHSDDHELIVQRTLRGDRSEGGSGRNRVRLGGELVPAAMLAELFADRIEISSQHSSQTLLRPEAQSRLLDESGGLLSSRDDVANGVAALRALDREIEALRGAADERARRQDFLSFQIREIDEVGLLPGELEELEASHGRLAHADRLLSDGQAACVALVGDADGGDPFPNAVDRVSLAARAVESLAGLDPALEALAERLAAQEAELFELGRDLERYLEKIDADPARLSAVEERLAEILRLQQKYGTTEAEIAAFREQTQAELDAISLADTRVDGLATLRDERSAALTDACAKLSRGRAKSAHELAKRVEASLDALSMSGARFEVALERQSPPDDLPCGAAGAERVEFRFSANPGEPVRPLRRVVSGGELSRVFLAVRNALRRSGAGMVLVFDEVDAGIGGRVAERVGRALVELSKHHQVLCITHLPQIAALADLHFRVLKSRRRGHTGTRVERIEGDARVDEIARMAGGESVTDATRRHAAELLKARSAPAAP